MTSGQYLGVIAFAWLGRLWWIFLVPFGFFIAGLFDWRFGVIGLIILMLVYPFMLTTALMSSGMRPETVRRAMSRRAMFADGSITLYKEVKSPEDDTIAYQPIETLPIKALEPRGKLTKIIVGSRLDDFVLLPTETVPHNYLS